MFKKIIFNALLLTLLTFTSIAQANVDDAFKYRFSISKSQQLVYDHFTNRIWQRCTNGEIYSNSSCQGQADSVHKSDMQKIITEISRRSNLPWRLPNSKELASIILCSNGIDKEYSQIGTRIPSPRKFFNDIPNICNKNNGVTSTIFPIHNSTYFSTRVPNLVYLTSDIVTTQSSISGSSNFLQTVEIPSGIFSNGNRGYLRLVFDATEIILKNEFPNINEYIVNGRNKLINTNWTWKPSIYPQYNLPIQGISQKNIIDLIALKLQEGIDSKVTQLPRAPQEPVKESNSYLPSNKGEFETTNDYNARVQIEKLNAERNTEIQNKEAMAKWQEEKLAYNALATDAAAFTNNKPAIAKLQSEITAAIFSAALGNPYLVNVVYDADKQEFSAQLLDNTFGKYGTVTASVPLKDAPKIKEDLLSGKLAPIVQISIPEFQLEWALKENAAFRIKRYEEAKGNTSNLVQFLSDYPDAPEASEAKSLIFTYAKTSNELNQLLTQHASWSEAKSAAPKLPQMQMQEYQEARKNGSSDSYEKFINNFGGTDTRGLLTLARKEKASAKTREDNERRLSAERWERDRPQREARERGKNICEAQKQSCYASCPPRAEGFRLDSSARNQCIFQCDRISCN